MSATPERLESIRERLAGLRPTKVSGRVLGVTGLVINASVPDAFIGEICWIRARQGENDVQAEVVGFRNGQALLMPLGKVRSIGLDSEVTRTGDYLKAPVGDELLGRVIDGLGNPLDGMALNPTRYDPVISDSPHPFRRERIRNQMAVGIKAIDSLLACGEGQRVGIFAAAGGGKSTLMGMMARYAQADAFVIVLVGERGREVTEFIEDSLRDGKAKSCVVVATADQPAVVRLKAAYMGTTIAEYFRDQGKKVILMMDSVTRFARAQREIGLARGEPPARYGFPPSVFAELPCLFERCGNKTGKGTLTGFYTVLVEGDNLDEPVADESKSLIDGHIILSPRVGYRPSIELLMSESRVKGSLTIPPEVRDAAEKVQAFLIQYKKDEQDISFGFFEGGDKAKAEQRKKEKRMVDEFMAQNQSEGIALEVTQTKLRELANQLPEMRLNKKK